MKDPIEEHEKTRTRALVALGEIIRTMEHEDMMGPGRIEVDQFHIKIPIKAKDYFAWEEALKSD